ncbi:transposase [Microvirga sp. BT689]|nr:transposase [Microvirga arvi]
MLSEVGVEGASVAEVARPHDITRQHLCQWRRDLRRNQLTAIEYLVLVPAEISDHPSLPTASPAVDCTLITNSSRSSWAMAASLGRAPDCPIRR